MENFFLLGTNITSWVLKKNPGGDIVKRTTQCFKHQSKISKQRWRRQGLRPMADDEFLHEVRLLQRRTRCSNFVCEEFVKTYKKFSPDPVKTRTVKTRIREFDNRAKNAAGCNYIILHGCPECNRHVYLPTDKATSCPFVKQDGNVCAHPRFDEHGKAFEVRNLTNCPLLQEVFMHICFAYFVYYYLLHSFCCAEGILLLYTGAVESILKDTWLQAAFRARTLAATWTRKPDDGYLRLSFVEKIHGRSWISLFAHWFARLH